MSRAQQLLLAGIKAAIHEQFPISTAADKAFHAVDNHPDAGKFEWFDTWQTAKEAKEVENDRLAVLVKELKDMKSTWYWDKVKECVKEEAAFCATDRKIRDTHYVNIVKKLEDFRQQLDE